MSVGIFFIFIFVCSICNNLFPILDLTHLLSQSVNFKKPYLFILRRIKQCTETHKSI